MMFWNISPLQFITLGNVPAEKSHRNTSKSNVRFLIESLQEKPIPKHIPKVKALISVAELDWLSEVTDESTFT